MRCEEMASVGREWPRTLVQCEQSATHMLHFTPPGDEAPYMEPMCLEHTRTARFYRDACRVKITVREL